MIRAAMAVIWVLIGLLYTAVIPLAWLYSQLEDFRRRRQKTQTPPKRGL